MNEQIKFNEKGHFTIDTIADDFKLIARATETDNYILIKVKDLHNQVKEYTKKIIGTDLQAKKQTAEYLINLEYARWKKE